MEQRELQAKIEQLEARLAALEQGGRAPKPRPRAPARRLGGRFALLAALAIVPAAAYAAVISVPNTFSNGTVADANEVNANFDTLVIESNDQHTRLVAVEAQVAANASSIATNTTVIATQGGSIATLQTDVGANTAGVAANGAAIAVNAGGIATNGSSITTLQADVGTNTTDIATLETTLAGVSRAGTLLIFSGMNLQVDDGSGDTGGAVNGLGNLIVGYGENTMSATRTGSHNLVVGPEHEYTSYGGLVAGYHGTVSGAHASVVGGQNNTAQGSYSTIAGGDGNTVTTSSTSAIGPVPLLTITP